WFLFEIHVGKGLPVGVFHHEAALDGPRRREVALRHAPIIAGSPQWYIRKARRLRGSADHALVGMVTNSRRLCHFVSTISVQLGGSKATVAQRLPANVQQD